MKSIIDVFQMVSVDPNVRANVIIQLGNLENGNVGSNVTEPIVYELVKLLNPDHPILQNEHYRKRWENSKLG